MKRLENRLIFVFIAIIGSMFSAICQSNFSPKYEFRGVWVATVDNIDWPSKKNLSSYDQKAEFIHLLDYQQQLGMNAVIVQIRPAADAFYPSQYEPWSEFLTGTQGKPPFPYYDPLKFMIEETHKRGMEFHAWLNPYRAVFNLTQSSVAADHITRKHPEWFLTYGGKKYFNPGLPEVREYVVNIVKDILTRYDIDGLHMDDYFYPYRITGKEFPDAATFKKYGNGLSKDDWRRSNCDSIIAQIHDAVVQIKPLIPFGISPFGVWRNKSQDVDGSNTQAGQTNYDDLYANILLWLQKGWIDYVAPQLYWEIGHHLCDYTTLLDWWSQHSYGKYVYVGHGIYNTIESRSPAWHTKNEMPNEIKLLRQNENIQGSIFFSSTNFNSNPNGWADSLQNNYYKSPALIPPMAWIDSVAPQKPIITNVSEDKAAATQRFIISGNTNANETEVIKNFVLYIADNFTTLGVSPTQIIPAENIRSFEFRIWQTQIPDSWNNCYISVSAVDKQNNESDLSNVMRLVKTNKGWMVSKK